MNIRFGRLATVCVATILSLAGCANTVFTDEQLRPDYKPRHHSLPIIDIIEKKPPTAVLDRARPIWIDPHPMPKLSQAAAGLLKSYGYKVVDQRENAEQIVAFDGYYRIMYGPVRTPRQVTLADLARGVDIEVVTDQPTRGLLRAGRDYASTAAWSGSANTPSQMLVAGLIGAGLEGILGALVPDKDGPKKSRTGHSDYRQRMLVRGQDVGLVCGGDEVSCEKSLLRARYGDQDLILALDFGQEEKQRSVVQVRTISEDLMPDRMLSEALSRLIALHVGR